jgi:LPXTG-site transpeptidase (sortase) family protein
LTGILPAGITFDGVDTISGTPTSGGTFAGLSVTATNGIAPDDTQNFSITINAPSISLSPATLPVATVSSAYSQTITASGGTASYTFAVTAGALPAGLMLSSGGTLTGTPTAGGTFNITVTATDSSTGTGPYTGSQAYSLTVNAPTISLSPATLPNGTLTLAYNQTINASGGTALYTFAVTAGTLPTNVTLSTAGLLSGPPTVNGTFNFTITATDSSTGIGPYTGSQAYSITINDNTQVTIDQAAGQADPTNAAPINFTVVFNQAVTGFATGDVSFTGSTVSGTLTGTITEIAPNNGTTYNVAVTGMTSTGNVVATIPAGVATGAATTNAASTSTDNTVTYDSTNPTVASTDLVASYTGTGPGSFTATFSKAVNDPAGNTVAEDVTNPANYLLVNKGTNGTADTSSCAGGVLADDTQVTVTSVVYNSVTFQATVTLVGALPVGSYRLFICGTTSVVDLVGNQLNDGTDYTFDFAVQANSQQGGGGNSNKSRGGSAGLNGLSIPITGFPQDKVTALPFQPADKAYASTDVWLEIPKLKVKMSIVGIPQTNGGWDISWLGKNAGWLNGSAFPTWKGNSVLTGHVWDASNRPGPFAGLINLTYGDQIKVHAFGQVYIYEVTESQIVQPSNIAAAFKHEETPWLTLITCENYQDKTETYANRRLVRAVLVSVVAEK